VFEDADTFDVTRAQREDIRNKHRAFGIGEHFCMGSHLARLELKVIFEEILKRIRNPEFDGEINWLRSNFIHGIKSMPIAFDVVEG
jgi:cholest-4-en-3-one 26-monooxygenase